MSGGRNPYRRGANAERRVVAALKAAGIWAARIPMSGAAGGEFSGDISLRVSGCVYIGECKYRRDGFKTLETWLDGRDLLFLCRPRQQPLVVLPLSTLVNFLEEL
jgi:hypothetical protein